MKKYRIIERTNSYTHQITYEIQTKSFFGVWYNPLNIDAYTTGFYDNLDEANEDINLLQSKTTRRYIMPRQDGTGPNGRGPKTGRGLGNCPEPSTTTTEKEKKTNFGSGWSRILRPGRGNRNRNGRK